MGEWDVDGMLARLSAEEFIEFGAFLEIDPQGPIRTDLGAAGIMCMIANALRDKNQASRKIADFMPKFDQPRKKWRPQSAEEIRDILAGMCARMNERKGR